MREAGYTHAAIIVLSSRYSLLWLKLNRMDSFNLQRTPPTLQ